MERTEYALMDRVEGEMWWYRALHARLRDALAGVQGPVLDAGCGTGGLLAYLRGRPGIDFYGLEYEHLAATRAAAKSGVRIVCGSINALPFASASFAAILSADVLCHAAVNPPAALAELLRVLRPGGRLVLNMPAYTWMMSAHDRQVHNARRTTASALATELRNAGFISVRARYWNTLLLPLMVLQRKVLARDRPTEKEGGDKGQTMSDVAVFPPCIDGTFHALTELERLSRLPMPAGGSVLATAERPP